MTTNRYIDTRNSTVEPIPFTQAVVKGLADGGGLFVPEHIPQLSLEEIVALADIPYAQRAARIYRAFDIDLSAEQIESLMQKAYGDNFDTEDICPITSLDEKTHVLELWHGPTSAFKDMALQCLPLFFEASAEVLRSEGNIDTEFMILVATSGDTGKAALEGFANRNGVSIGVLYPDGGVSDIQRKQMITQSGDNVVVWAVRGNFDNCQTSAKRIFNDSDFACKLKTEYGVALSSANSINWGRLLPQVVYYLSSYAQLVRSSTIEAGQAIDICVPTGHFGNILAAWYAKKIGAPIERLLCASNENRVLTDFINTGTYTIVDRPFILTPSPSMDILVSSNLERQLFELTGRDGSAISYWMKDLAEKGCFRIDPHTFTRLRAEFASDSVSNDECLRTIKETFDAHGYLIDPHTAVACKVAERLRSNNPVLIASTAHWAKFGGSVYRALHELTVSDSLPREVEQLTDCELNDLISQETGCGPIPAGLASLDTMKARFTTVIDSDKSAVEEAISLFLSSIQ